MSRALIICPTFDHQDTLYPTLESVRRQTFQDFEVVVIGDGAPERTRAIMADITAQDARFRYVRNPKHQRMGEPYRDPIIRASTCDVVAYIADDDLWLPWHLEWLVEALRTHDFAHSMHFMVHADGHVQAIPFQFASPALRRKIVKRETWCFGLSFAAHTRDAYLALEEGWATTPPGVPTDLNMWAKFAEHDGLSHWEMSYPTALHLHAGIRRGTAPAERAAEARGILDVVGSHAFLDRLFERASFTTHFAHLFHSVTPTQLRDPGEVFGHHGLSTEIIGADRRLPARPAPGVLYCHERSWHALDVAWRHHAGHASAAESVAALQGLLSEWPGNHDARVQLAKLLLASAAPEAAECVLRPLDPARAATTYTGIIARVLLAQRKFVEALDVLRVLLENDPGNAYLHHHRGVALDGLGQRAAAVASWRAALAIKPDLYWSRRRLQTALNDPGWVRSR